MNFVFEGISTNIFSIFFGVFLCLSPLFFLVEEAFEAKKTGFNMATVVFLIVFHIVTGFFSVV